MQFFYKRNQTKNSFWLFLLHLTSCSIHQMTQKYKVRIDDGFRDKDILLAIRESDEATYTRIRVIIVAVFQSCSINFNCTAKHLEGQPCQLWLFAFNSFIKKLQASNAAPIAGSTWNPRFCSTITTSEVEYGKWAKRDSQKCRDFCNKPPQSQDLEIYHEQFFS